MSVSFCLGGVTATIHNPDLDDKLDLDSHQVVQPKATGGFYRFALAAVADMPRELRWSNLSATELYDSGASTRRRPRHAQDLPLYRRARAQLRRLFPHADARAGDRRGRGAFDGSFDSGGNEIPTTQRTGGTYELTVRLHLASPATFSTAFATTPPPTRAPTDEPTEEPTTDA